MAVRNSEELGKNLMKIVRRLSSNQTLLKYLKSTKNNPLSSLNIDPSTVINKNIRVKPYVDPVQDKSESTIVVLFSSGEVMPQNGEFKEIECHILVYVPIEEWTINDDAVRPFVLMSEIEKSLKDKEIDGFGKLDYEGFKLDILTDEICAYRMMFKIENFN